MKGLMQAYDDRHAWLIVGVLIGVTVALPAAQAGEWFVHHVVCAARAAEEEG